MMSTSGVELQGLLEAAGRSFGRAQEEIGLPDGMTTSMVISEAELDLRVGVRLDRDRLRIEPVSAAQSMKSGMVAQALSTLKVRYVAARSETPADARPTRSAPEVEAEVKGRKDVAALAEVLGPLVVSTRYVPELRFWAARVESQDGLLVRTVNLPDRR